MRRGCTPLSLAILILIIGVLLVQFRSGGNPPYFLAVNEVADEVIAGSIVRLVVDRNDVEIIFNDGTSAFTRIEEGKTLIEQLRDLGVSAEHLASNNLSIEVRDPGLFDPANIVQFLTIGVVGFILGALAMFALARSGLISLRDMS